MQALIVIDVQNEFSEKGKRPVPNHLQALEAIMRGLDVCLDPEATGACEICHPLLGTLTADEVRRSAILHLLNMGAKLKG